jgi:dienelactone hydrolase
MLGVGLVGALALERATPFTLPVPTGPFSVGRVVEDWTDSTSTDPLAPKPSSRELLVWIWYPAAGDRGAALADYVPADLRGPGVARTPLLFRLLTRDPSKVRSNSEPNAPLAPSPRTYPVLVMRGGASAPVVNYSTLAEDLASHGYVVVAFDAPYRTSVVAFPDGRAVARLPANNPELAFGSPDSARLINGLLGAWTSDIGFVLDRLHRLNMADAGGRFAGRLTLTRVGIFGHSLGGVEAAQFCAQDARCGAGVDIDGAPVGVVQRDTIRRPFMFLLSDHGDASRGDSGEIMAAIRSIYDRLPSDSRVIATIRGANHFTFSDDGALLKSGIVRWTLRRFGALHIDGRRQLAITAYCLRSFFDAYVKAAGATAPAMASRDYPELLVTARSHP